MKEWALQHPWMTLIILLSVIYAVADIVHGVAFKLPNRILRHRSIKAQGWPPPHCDADGEELTTEIEE